MRLRTSSLARLGGLGAVGFLSIACNPLEGPAPRSPGAGGDDAPLVRRVVVKPIIDDPCRVPFVILVGDSDGTEEGGPP